MHGEAHSSRGKIRLILPGTGDDCGNSEYRVAINGDRRRVIREVVERELTRVAKLNRKVWWARCCWHVTVDVEYGKAVGTYRVAVWNDGAVGEPRFDLNVSEHTRPPVCGC
jgi:hypothetical protein